MSPSTSPLRRIWPTVVAMALVTALVTTLGMASPGTAAWADEDEPANLLANAGFEEGTAPEELAGWTPWSSRSVPYFSTSTETVSEGIQSLHLHDDSTSHGGGLVSDPVPAQPDTTYEVNLNVHHVSGSFSVWLYFHDEDGNELSSQWQTVRTAVGAWERAFLEFRSPAGAATGQVMVYSGNGPVADVYVDDLYLGLPGGSGHEPPSIPDQVIENDPNLSYLGTPVGSRVTKNSVVAEEDGQLMSYRVFRGVESAGTSATLVVADLLTGEIVRSLPLRGVDFSQELRVSSDGLVYIVTTGPGYGLWVYDPATTELRDLGSINPSDPAKGYGWSLAAADDGVMYIGTYPEGLLFRYDPSDGSITNLGAVDPEQAYIHALAWDSERDVLYVGTGGSSAQIWKVTADGTRTALLNDENAPGVTDLAFVTTFTFVDDRLFARASNQLLVINAEDEVEYWKGAGNEIHGYQLTPRPDSPQHYLFGFGSSFWEYDATTGTTRDLGIEINGYLSDSVWVQLDDPAWPGWTLVAATSGGVAKLNLETGTSELHAVDHYAANTVQQLFRGPDQMYASGYLTGLAGFDSTTGIGGPTLQSGQYEAAAVRNGKLLLAAYGDARLMEYDPTTGAAPRQIFTSQPEGQDRPRMDYDPDHDRIFMGTVAKYGHNQGALMMYDFATDTKKTWTTEIVTEQSVISVLHHDGLVYLGTTIDGGLGAPASGQTEGHFIVWDPEAERIVDDIVPVAGDEGVTGLMVGPDGLIWGVSENTVFTYDPEQGEMVFSEPLLRHRYGSGTVWVWADLAIGADGMVYGTNRFSFFRIDPSTMAYTDIVPTTVLGAPIRNAVADEAGNILFSHGAFVFKYSVPQPECTEEISGEHRGRIEVADGAVLCVTDARIIGGITVAPGGSLVMSDTELQGSLTATSARTVQVRDSTVRAAVSVAGTAGSFVLAGSQLRGSVTCRANLSPLTDENRPNRLQGVIDEACGVS